MNVSEYIVNFLVEKHVDHIFGYQGTMIAYLIDAIYKNKNITNHSCYNEQAAAFAAVGYAKSSRKVGVAYATSGPGALNLISGIADAYYDSVPSIFFTGQINTNEYTNVTNLRQQGFQETNVVDIFTPISKYCVQITKADDIAYYLEKAWCIANSGRKGPVVLDLPMNIQRTVIQAASLKHYEPQNTHSPTSEDIVSSICDEISKSRRPLFLFGNGIDKTEISKYKVRCLLKKYGIPVVTSILGKSLIEETNEYNLGFIGAAYGHRCANIIAYRKADLIISLGCSMNRRQTGLASAKFASSASIIRVDIDPIELKRKVHDNEISYCFDANLLIDALLDRDVHYSFTKWLDVCKMIKNITNNFDNTCEYSKQHKLIDAISNLAPSNAILSCDVGQHQMWVAQAYKISDNKQILFSGGHGAMGFSLPAGIGAYYSTGEKVLVVAGDGAFQMNIQELQWIKRECIPLTMFVLNNSSLGLIRQQQDDFFDGNRYASIPEWGYTSPEFVKIATAYGIKAYKVHNRDELLSHRDEIIQNRYPILIEVMIDSESKAFPKTYFGETMDNQKPYLDKEILNEIYRM